MNSYIKQLEKDSQKKDDIIHSLEDELKHLTVKEKQFRLMAIELWKLLDWIDTCDDIAKDSDASFRRNVILTVPRRCDYMESLDGQKLYITNTKELVEDS